MCRERIASIKDSRVVEARTLASTAGRLRNAKILLFGIEQIRWALREGMSIDHIFVEDTSKTTQLESLPTTVPILSVSTGISKKITGTNYVVPVVGVATLPSPRRGAASRFALVLDGVRDAGNIGTLVRTARAFGIHDVWGTHREFDPFTRKSIDASRGLVFSTSFYRCDSPKTAVSQLRRAGYEIVATSPHATTLQSQIRLSGKPLALVAGNETSGVSRELSDAADQVIQVPMRAVESLNVAVSTGISIYELGFKLVLAKMTESIRETLGRNFGATHELMHRLLDMKLREIGPVGADEIIFLMRLACDRQSPLTEAAADAGLRGESLEQFLDQLAAQGWLIRERRSSDEVVSITGKGEELLANLWPVVESTHDLALKGFTADEQAHLHSLLERIQDNCHEELDRRKQEAIPR